jgi:ketosteroid isomerase-like protein
MKTLTLLVIPMLIAASAWAQGKKSAANSNPEATIRAMEERWEAALGKHDAKTVSDMVASDFNGVDPKNAFMTKSHMLDRMKKDADTYSSTSLKNMKVRIYGPNSAVAIGDANEKGSGKDGKTFDRTYRFTDTWVARGGKWECVAEQVAQISGCRPK